MIENWAKLKADIQSLIENVLGLLSSAKGIQRRRRLSHRWMDVSVL